MSWSRSQQGRVVAYLIFSVAAGWLVPMLPAQVHFVRGDVDEDGRWNISDGVRVLRHLFVAEEPAISCEDSADIDDDGTVAITDAIYLFQYLFTRGPPPPYPFPHCDVDITDDSVGCAEYASCSPLFEFYGREHVGGGVFFVIDRSGSMWDSGELVIAKREVIGALETLPEEAEFGIVFFDSAIRRFPSTDEPALATPANVEAATSWIDETPAGGGSCIESGLLQGLAYARQSTARRQVLIYVGDGGGTCRGVPESQYLAETVDSITELNQGRMPIHCVGVLMEGRVVQEAYLQELADRNGGRYRRVN